MKLKFPVSKALFRVLAAATMLVLAPFTNASTVWTGPNTNFNQTTSNPTDVLIAGAVSFTRGSSQWLYNPAAGETFPGTSSPADTMWAMGSIANFQTLTYKTFASYRGGDLAGNILNKAMVVHLVSQDIYVSITFTKWGQHGAGGFAYTRSTPSAAAPAPTVSLTSPANGAAFTAPAKVQITATASVSSGTVTNVAFFANGSTALGFAQTSPFSITSSSLAAGSYALTAVATAAGISTTSSVVNITVAAPAAVSLGAPSAASGQFAFSYTASAGSSYVVQKSSDLVNWLPISTNVASSSTVQFSDPFNPTGSFYYRVGQLPNP